MRVRLCQDLSALFEVLDLRRTYSVETGDEPVLQDACDLLGGMEPRDVDEVGAGLIEMKRLRYVVGREHDFGFGTAGACITEQPQIVGATQDVVGNAAHDELRVLDARVTKGVGVRDIAVDDADPSLLQLSHHRGVEIDNQDLVEHDLPLDRGAFALELQQDRARVAVEPEKDHRLGSGLLPLRRGLTLVEIPDMKKSEPSAQDILDAVTRVDHVGRYDGCDREGHDHDRHHVGADLVIRQPDRSDDDRELAHLGEVDRRQQTRAVAHSEEIQNRHDRKPAQHDEGGRGEGNLDHLKRGYSNLHAKRDEEEGDEEVADADRFGHDVEVVRKGGQAHSRDQRPHLARKPDHACSARQEEAPRERADQHELGRFGD